MSDNYEDLEKLNDLKQKGIITEEEFNAKKREILLKSQHVPKQVQKETYSSLNSHYQKVFQRYDAVTKEAKEIDKYPGFNKLASWNWGAFFFGPFWLLYRKRFIDFSIYLGLVILGYTVYRPLLIVAIIYCFSFAIWGDFYEYYKLKTGKASSFKTPKTMIKELM